MKVPMIARLARSSTAWVVLVTLIGACSLVPATRPGPAITPDVAEAPPGAGAASAATPVAETNVAQRGATRPSLAARRNGPPDGLLGSGSESVAGKLGSYCYGNTCLDIAKWPPKFVLPHLVAGRRLLEFQLRNGEKFVGWRASYSANPNEGRSDTLGQGGESFDPDANQPAADRFASAQFDAPPAGDWVVWLKIDLAGGDLSYAWRVTVLPDTATDP